jgi:hypothetical protein
MRLFCGGGTLRTLSVFLPRLPQNLPELRRQIIATLSQIDRDMLQRVWAEMYVLSAGLPPYHTGRTHRELMGYVTNKYWRIPVSLCRLHVNPLRHSSLPIT